MLQEEGVINKMTNTELKSIRKALDLSKTDFARAIGISPVMEGKYEKGSREIPDAVSQAAYKLLNAAEQEPQPVVDEEDAFEDREEAAPVAYETPAEDEISASVAYEAPAEDEISASVTEETAEPAIEDVTSPAVDEPAAEEVTPAADADQAVVDVSASAAEETAAVAEKAPAKEKKNKTNHNASSEENDADTVNWGASALPFFVPPLLMTQLLINTGFMLSPKKKGFFWPWW